MIANARSAAASKRPDPIRSRGLRRQRWTTLIFALVILIPSGYGFTRKLIELIALIGGDTDGVFAISPVVNYLLASVGFFFLFCWAILNGMFGDIEGPKRTMLKVEEMLDVDEETFGPNGFEPDKDCKDRYHWN
jgi:hypothetical protein